MESQTGENRHHITAHAFARARSYDATQLPSHVSAQAGYNLSRAYIVRSTAALSMVEGVGGMDGTRWYADSSFCVHS